MNFSDNWYVCVQAIEGSYIYITASFENCSECAEIVGNSCVLVVEERAAKTIQENANYENYPSLRLPQKWYARS